MSSLPIIAALCVLGTALTASAQIKAQDSDTPSYVEFTSARFEVSETETNAVVTIVRYGDYRKTAAVDFKTLEGSAEDNVDFQPSGGTLTFAAGQSFKTVTIPVLRNGKPSPLKAFKVELMQAAPGTIITSAAAVVEIKQAGPALSIALAADGLLVAWPDVGLAYKLEAQFDGAWSSVATGPSLADGNFTVRIAPTGPLALFRLRLE